MQHMLKQASMPQARVQLQEGVQMLLERLDVVALPQAGQLLRCMVDALHHGFQHYC